MAALTNINKPDKDPNVDSPFDEVNKQLCLCIDGLESIISVENRETLDAEIFAKTLATTNDMATMQAIENVSTSQSDVKGLANSIRVKRELMRIRQQTTSTEFEMMKPMRLQASALVSRKPILITTYHGGITRPNCLKAQKGRLQLT